MSYRVTKGPRGRTATIMLRLHDAADVCGHNHFGPVPFQPEAGQRWPSPRRNCCTTS